ncbi:MAG: hypothetical protein K2P81_00215 [Bacteriovoracaceae bacterium]|nr:hypothetical protein [Bacteriovoracaceae bacterium]
MTTLGEPMTGITEQDVQDFLLKTEEFLAELSSDEREEALKNLSQQLHAYAHTMPGADFTKVKMALGGPRGAANFIRLKHKIPLQYTSAPNVKRAVSITLLSGLIAFFLILGVLWWKFTPILSVKEDRVQVLGGLIDIDGQLGQFKVGDSYEFSDSQFKNVFEGSYEIPPEQVEDVVIEFDRGQLEVSYTQESRLVWTCKVSAEPSDGFIRQEKEVVTMNLKSVGGTDCSIKVPAKFKYTINGDAGKVDIIAPANDTFVQLGNGMVVIAADSELSYRFDLKVGQGIVDPSFKSLSKEDGIELKVELGNGSIQKK